MASNATRKAVAKAAKGGKSPISGMGSIVQRAMKATRNGPKASETDHLQGKEFSGKHHAPSSMTSAKKNASGSMSDPARGRHALSNGPVGHRGGHSREKDVAGAYKDSVGSGYKGKHRKPGA